MLCKSKSLEKQFSEKLYALQTKANQILQNYN